MVHSWTGGARDKSTRVGDSGVPAESWRNEGRTEKTNEEDDLIWVCNGHMQHSDKKLKLSMNLPAIFSIEHCNPPYEFKQEWVDSAADFLERNCRYPRNDRNYKYLARLLGATDIDRRFFSFPDARPDCKPEDRILVPSNPDLPDRVTITEKNELFVKTAIEMATTACKKALDEWGGDYSEITHVVSVTCTGMIAPGVEFHVITKLGLPANAQRLGVNMMGCYGATRGLTVAKALAIENPKNRVLLFCCETCSVQFPTFRGRWEEFLGVILFADGCGAAVIGIPDTDRPKEHPLLCIGQSATQIISHTPDEMAWWAEVDGFIMRLTREVPAAVTSLLDVFLRKEILHVPYDEEAIKNDKAFDRLNYAFHPGGKAILDLIQKQLNLTDEQMGPSRKILREYGNMSSATLMFTIADVIRNKPEWCESGRKVVSMAFGPGLAVDSVLLIGPGPDGQQA